MDSKEVILLGDLNVDYLKPRDNKDIKALFLQNGFTQIISEPTRVTEESKSLIDVIATTNPGNIARFDVIAKSLSDHDLIRLYKKT